MESPPPPIPPATPPTPPGPPVSPPPPRAFTQGVGTVYQFAGTILFMVMLLICCGSALLSPQRAMRWDMTHVGWHLPGDPEGQPTLSVVRMTASAVFGGVFFGLALAGLGLGMQAQHRGAAAGAVIASGIGAIFWGVLAVFAIVEMGSVLLALAGIALFVVFAVLFGFAIAAMGEMIRNPPPPGHEVLPADYKVPYSHLHQDPPEVRLARELEQRRQRLAVEQKELEIMEQKLRRRQEER